MPKLKLIKSELRNFPIKFHHESRAIEMSELMITNIGRRWQAIVVKY